MCQLTSASDDIENKTGNASEIEKATSSLVDSMGGNYLQLNPAEIIYYITQHILEIGLDNDIKYDLVLQSEKEVEFCEEEHFFRYTSVEKPSNEALPYMPKLQLPPAPPHGAQIFCCFFMDFSIFTRGSKFSSKLPRSGFFFATRRLSHLETDFNEPLRLYHQGSVCWAEIEFNTCFQRPIESALIWRIGFDLVAQIRFFIFFQSPIE